MEPSYILICSQAGTLDSSPTSPSLSHRFSLTSSLWHKGTRFLSSAVTDLRWQIRWGRSSMSLYGFPFHTRCFLLLYQSNISLKSASHSDWERCIKNQITQGSFGTRLSEGRGCFSSLAWILGLIYRDLIYLCCSSFSSPGNSEWPAKSLSGQLQQIKTLLVLKGKFQWLKFYQQDGYGKTFFVLHMWGKSNGV